MIFWHTDDMVLYDYHHGILNRMFSQETITDVHLYLDCFNFNCCLVGNFNETPNCQL